MININENTNFEALINERDGHTVDFEDLKGKSIFKIFQVHDDKIVIVTNCGFVYVLLHYQDCCESVYIEDVCGDLTNSTGLVVRAEVAQNRPDNPTKDDSETWTFYKLDTIKDNVTIRFCGHSNGYYSEEVTVKRFFAQEFAIVEKLQNF